MSAALAKALVPHCSDHFAVTGLSERTRTKIFGQLATKYPRLAKSASVMDGLSKAHFGGSVPKPEVLSGAEWQAGLTYHSDRFKVLLDDEPLPLAFAANARRGWVKVYVDGSGESMRLSATTKTIHGDVKIIRGDRC